MPLALYNTLSKQKEPFEPLDPNYVRMYVCGPTVYDFAHIGNARPVVVFDVLFRLLKNLYKRVVYVRNITDVDDKINTAAKENKENIRQLTDRTTEAYHDDMNALNALPPTREPRATEHIPQMIHMIEELIKKDFAYPETGHVLFETGKYKNYGALARRSLDEMIAGARIEVALYKRNPGDFVLWKPSHEDEPGWDSPWGRGRPGWHIECSAMSAAYLGEEFDIHGGGIDLVFPHHENEVAQSCAAHGTERMAKYWLHNGHLMVDGSKMSKSLGNFLTVRDLLSEHQGETIRYALLASHYRQPLDFTKDQLMQAKQSLDKFYRALGDAGNFSVDLPHVEPDSSVMEALLDDMNTPLALTHLQNLVTDYNKSKDPAVAAKLKKSAYFLGILEQNPKNWFMQSVKKETLSAEAVEGLIQRRNQARKDRDFKAADALRLELDEAGVLLEDSLEGTKWRWK